MGEINGTAHRPLSLVQSISPSQPNFCFLGLSSTHGYEWDIEPKRREKQKRSQVETRGGELRLMVQSQVYWKKRNTIKQAFQKILLYNPGSLEGNEQLQKVLYTSVQGICNELYQYFALIIV